MTTSSSASQRAVLIGASQFSQRDVTLETAMNPLEMFTRIAEGAAAASGTSDPKKLLASVDAVALTSTMGWEASNPARLVGDALGASLSTEWVSHVGGETSIALVNGIAERIVRGETGLGFVAGCNNMKSLGLARRAGTKLAWPEGGAGVPETVGKEGWGHNDFEAAAGLTMPINIYPLFENALRFKRGQSLEEHARAMGELMHSFTVTAAANPHAWFPTERSAEELVTPSPLNRPIFFPYPKYLNAVMATEQAAGTLIASEELADRLGVPETARVYWRGGAFEVESPWHVSERPSFDEAPSIATCHRTALSNAGLALEEIELIDFYSCFPIAVAMAAEMLGLDPKDPRGFSITGGLPYAGGPGSSYSFHSLATAVERLQRGYASNALITGNGWYLTKHSAAVLSTAPNDATPSAAPDSALAAHWTKPPVVLDKTPEGPATVETYTIGHDRDGTPNQGIVIARLDATGARCLANTPADPTLLAELESREMIGTRGRVANTGETPTFTPA